MGDQRYIHELAERLPIHEKAVSNLADEFHLSEQINDMQAEIKLLMHLVKNNPLERMMTNKEDGYDNIVISTTNKKLARVDRTRE
jgi:hypothetical protein